MKSFIKKLTVFATTLSLLAATLVLPIQASAKNTYWLAGISKGAGGNMRMFCTENTITVKGKIKKSASPKKLDDVAEKKLSYKLKVAKNCTVHFFEAENEEIITYKQWAKKESKEVGFISSVLKVKNNKVVRIGFSA